MVATDELRRMLDERGVDYRVSATGYSIDIGPHITAYANRSDTTLDVSLRNFTPAQAVEATLGRGECRRVLMDCAGNPPYYTGGFALNDTCNGCSECGYPWRTHGLETPNYCPNCGRRVEQ